MARVVDARGSVLVGTPKELNAFLRLLWGRGAAIVKLTGSRIIVRSRPLKDAELLKLLKAEKSKSRKSKSRTRKTGR